MTTITFAATATSTVINAIAPAIAQELNWSEADYEATLVLKNGSNAAVNTTIQFSEEDWQHLQSMYAHWTQTGGLINGDDTHIISAAGGPQSESSYILSSGFLTSLFTQVKHQLTGAGVSSATGTITQEYN